MKKKHDEEKDGEEKCHCQKKSNKNIVKKKEETYDNIEEKNVKQEIACWSRFWELWKKNLFEVIVFRERIMESI